MVKRVLMIVAAIFAAQNANAAPKDPAKKLALELYEQAERAYNLGNFDRAIELSKKAYETHPAPEFLFNIAQAYRQLDNCEKALFFYRRFLALNPSFPQRKEVEDRIVDLDRRCEEKKKVREKPPEGTRPATSLETAPASVQKPASVAVPMQAPRATTTTTVALESKESFPIELEAQLGFGSLSFGGLDIPLGIAGRVAVTTDIAISRSWSFQAGIFIAPTRVPYQYTRGDLSSSGAMISIPLGATAGFAYRLSESFAFRTDLGLGVSLLSGLGGENQFTRNSEPATGVIVLPVLNARLGLQYEIVPRFALSLSPVGVTFMPSTDRLREGSGGMLRIDALAGIRYGF